MSLELNLYRNHWNKVLKPLVYFDLKKGCYILVGFPNVNPTYKTQNKVEGTIFRPRRGRKIVLYK